MSDDTETPPKQRPGASPKGRSAGDTRAERLAAALKANLGRRKAAAIAARDIPPAADATGNEDG